MLRVDREVDRYLTLLRNKIRERGFTQLEVQESLGWGRSYISQLLTKQKTLRLEQMLSILSVIGIEPRDFFAQLYSDSPRVGVGKHLARRESSHELRHRLERAQALLGGLTDLLRKKGLISQDALEQAVAEAAASSGEPDSDLPLFKA